MLQNYTFILNDATIFEMCQCFDSQDWHFQCKNPQPPSYSQKISVFLSVGKDCKK